jgi:putative nucleotidyltransferase with HDIG domain
MGMASAATVMAVALVLLGFGAGNVWVIAALGIAAAFAERGTVRLSETTELSISPALMLFGAVLFGPLAGGVIGAASELGDNELLGSSTPGRQPYLKWLNYTSSRFVAGVAMGACAMAVREVSDDTTGLVLATLAGSIVGEALEILFASVTSAVRGNQTRLARSVGPLMVTAVVVYAPVVAALAYAYSEISPWTALLFLAPAIAAQRLFSLNQERTQLFNEQVKLTRELTVANETLRTANLSFAAALVQTLEESDRYTAGHSRAVATYSRDIAEQLAMPENNCDFTYLCGLVHDIGKIGLPAAVLNKEGRLTLEERREMEKHSEIGERILSKVAAYSDVARIVRHHHERIDGEGYPDRLRANDIPAISKIIAVADAYNAMTSDRPYRKAMPYQVARDRLLQAMGSQFEPECVVAFIAVLATRDAAYREARGDGFGPIEPGSAAAVVSAFLHPAAIDAA